MSKTAITESLRQNLRQALQQRQPAEAEQILARLKVEDPLSVHTRGFELEVCLETNRLAEAVKIADQLCRSFPDSARIFFLAGKLAYRLKHYEVAEAHLRESQRIHPSPQTQYWLGKTLTQTGGFEEAESLLLSVQNQNPWALLGLAWLYERKGQFEAALTACDRFLNHLPDNPLGTEQRLRIRAKMLDPETLIEEANALSDLGEALPPAIFPELVEKLFETGQAPRAREEISARMHSLDSRECVHAAWICYRFQAYDLACTLFMMQLKANLSNFKYLAALESAARKCGRLSQVLEAYQPLCPEAKHLYGRCRLLSRVR